VNGFDPRRWRDEVLGGALRDLVLRPWYDRVSMAVLGDWYFPVSRLWAAALGARGSVAAFAEAVPTVDPSTYLAARAVEGIDRLRCAHDAAETRWDNVLFGAGPAEGAALARAEALRLGAAHALMAARWHCVPLHVLRRGPAVAFSVSTEEAVSQRHGARLADPGGAFAPPRSVPPVARSFGFETEFGRVSWLRMAAPVPLVEGDTMLARVYEPPRPRATVVLAHGVGIESEMWRGLAAPPAALIEAGCRVVQPVAPWHGHRAAPGRYGGEPIFAGGPMALLDFLHAGVLELGLLIAWARSLDDEPAALGGVSLGALTAQRLATAAHCWSAAMIPDALLLVTASASISAVGYTGSLPAALGVPEALETAGWTQAKAERWAPLLEPGGPPALDPARVVMILGDADDVLPYREGVALADAWSIPDENRFVSRRGHFTTSLGIRYNDAPYRRLLGAMRLG
jgi:pimeloyl-ACP methyl ester carboxylesterase